MEPSTQTCPELWIPSSAEANGLKAPLAIATATAAALGSTAKTPMFRVTVWGPPIRFTVGVNPRGHDGNACSSLDFQ